ncbi:MAG: SsrA-binding protein, partial [Candidatus Riflebacteria bacterium]|nr:SsrA-binding protein [Candidatus Riflebacteria bacterium]
MSSKKQDKSGIKIIAENRKAYHDYFILEKLETGIALVGSEL